MKLSLSFGLKQDLCAVSAISQYLKARTAFAQCVAYNN